jgi:hypothetical protein
MVRKWADSGKWYENIKTFNEHKIIQYGWNRFPYLIHTYLG